MGTATAQDCGFSCSYYKAASDTRLNPHGEKPVCSRWRDFAAEGAATTKQPPIHA
jgi:hypothetical protein